MAAEPAGAGMGAEVRPEHRPADRPARRARTRAAACLLVALALAAPAGAAADGGGAADVHGVWVDHREGDKRKVAVWIEDCDGRLCGRIYWLKKPMSAGGHAKLDRHNPDAALRDRPLCGLRILTGFRHAADGTWNAGQIYNPNDGRTFSSTMALQSDGSLRIRGYVGFSLFGRTVEWVRPEEIPERCR